MTHWHDPLVEVADARSSSSLLDKACDSSFPDSRSHQAFACRRWRVPVSSLVYCYFWFSRHNSWEMVLNLDYEYSIITGKRKFNLAVPVRTLSASVIREVFIPQSISFT